MDDDGPGSDEVGEEVGTCVRLVGHPEYHHSWLASAHARVYVALSYMSVQSGVQKRIQKVIKS